MNHTKTKKTEHKIGFIVLLLSLLFSLFPAVGSTTFALAQGERKQVLYINSYHPGYKFSDDIQKGLTAAFQEQGNVTLRVEYLDTKRLNSPEYLEEVNQLFKLKYKDADLDLVMSSDDAALNFLFQNADALFPNIPVVFVGANYFDETRLKGYERFTGISEEADIRGTIDLALGLHPGVRNIVVVNDTTVTGQNIHRAFDTLMPQYPQINFEFLEDVTMDEIRQRVGTLPQDSLVLLTIFSKDKAGTFFEYDQYTSLIAESSSVPVYGAWDFSLDYGIVGGKLTSGQVEGERAAKLALRILKGEDSTSIPVDKQVKSQYMFDYKVMEKWGIEVSSLPKDSVILNRPVSFYEENMGVIWGVLIGFILLISIIVFLAINNNQRRMAQAELATSNRELKVVQGSLEQRVTDRTKALATSTEVSRRLSTILDQKELVREVVNQVNNAFGYYHTQIYFYDEAKANLVMAGGTGESGRMMLAQFHKLAKGRGLVGRAAENNEPILVTDTAQNPEWLPNPLLPETKAEAAIPISIGDEVLGVLDVQHNIVDGLKREDIDALQSIANQVAVAVQNARSYSETQEAQKLTRNVIDSTDDWIFIKDQDHRYQLVNQGYAKSLHIPIADFIGKNDLELGFPEELVKGNPEKGIAGFWADDRAVMDSGVTKQIPDDLVAIDGNIHVFDTVKVPLRDANNKVWGVLAFARDMTERRSLEELNRKRATQQEAINQITQKIQGTTSIEMALQITARELGHALGMKSTLVTLDPEALAGEHKSKS